VMMPSIGRVPDRVAGRIFRIWDFIHHQVPLVRYFEQRPRLRCSGIHHRRV